MLKSVEVRSRLLQRIRRFFIDRDYWEVETPILVPAPTLEPYIDSFEVPLGTNERRWLSTSPEFQMKQLLCAGCERIFQICKCFRKNEIGPLHESEFTMLEWYRVGFDSSAMMQETTDLVLACCGTHRFEYQGMLLDVSPPWETLRVADAFARFASKPLAECLQNEELFFRVMVDEIEPSLPAERPVFLTHWPAAFASLARLHPDDAPEDAPDDAMVAERFELYLAGMELCNGFAELTDATEQRRRFRVDQERRRRASKEVYPLDEAFLAALERGLPEAAGNALGVDRLLMLLMNASTLTATGFFGSSFSRSG